MHDRIASVLASVWISLAGALGLLGGAEAFVRIAEVEPAEIPGPGGKPPPDGVRIDPLFGPRLRPNWSGRWHQEGYEVASDARGFRVAGAASEAGRGPRIAFLGDSCTFGWGLDTEETFTTGIAELALASGRPVEIVNAGYPGDSAGIGPHLLADRVLPLEPEVVVIGYSGNNAFRFALIDDVARFAAVPRQRRLFRSRLLAIAHAWTRRDPPDAPNPRDPVAVRAIPLRERRRVLPPADFEAALRTLVATTRAAGSRPVFLLLPRASQVSRRFAGEDPAIAVRLEPRPDHLESHLLQYSCLAPRALADPEAEIVAAAEGWRSFYPHEDENLQMRLYFSAKARALNQRVAAIQGFEDALELDPTSPLALYDAGALQIERGDVAGGSALLERAEESSCNVFVQYQRVLRRVAADLAVPVIDAMLDFQAHRAGLLFLDPAHPSAAAKDVIAGAAWPVISAELAKRAAEN